MEDRYRQAESHKGKLNSLVNVGNQGANLPNILAAFQEQPIRGHYPSLSVSFFLLFGAICQSPQLFLLEMIHLVQQCNTDVTFVLAG